MPVWQLRESRADLECEWEAAGNFHTSPPSLGETRETVIPEPWFVTPDTWFWTKSLPIGALINQLPDTAAQSKSLGSHVLLIRSEGEEAGKGRVGRQAWESEMKSPRSGVAGGLKHFYPSGRFMV